MAAAAVAGSISQYAAAGVVNRARIGITDSGADGRFAGSRASMRSISSSSSGGASGMNCRSRRGRSFFSVASAHGERRLSRQQPE
jgi:hypothetical protein